MKQLFFTRPADRAGRESSTLNVVNVEFYPSVYCVWSQVTLRSSGYSELATSEIIASMAVLARYGILGMGLGLASTPVASAAPALPSPSHQAATGLHSAFLGLGVAMDSTPGQPQRDSGVFGAIGTMTGISTSTRNMIEKYVMMCPTSSL